MPVKKIILLLAVLVAGFIAPSLVTFAQENESREGIGVSPTTIAINADPGETVEGSFTVINSGTEPVKYRTYVRDLGVANEEYDRTFEEPIPGIESPVDWFKVTNDTGELAANDQVSVNYSVAVPDGTTPRGYYAVIFAETLPSNPDTTGVARVKRVGSLVYLTVNGGSVKDGRVLGLTVGRWQRDKNIKPEIRVENTGNVHFEVDGEVRLKDVFGRTVRSSTIHGTVLPSTIRKFSPDLAANMPVGLYKVDGEVKMMDQSIKLGSEWILVASPIWLAVIVVIIVVWIISLVLWIRRRVQRKKTP